MARTLVACFSASGTTAEIAQQLARLTSAELYEIRPKEPYTKQDLDWTNPNSRSSVEMKNRAFRPELADRSAGVAEADVIFVGFPIWWYVAPTIVNSFLEAYDFSGKTLVFFATSGGSGFGKTVQELRTSVSPTAHLIEGGLLNGKYTDAQLQDWIENLGI